MFVLHINLIFSLAANNHQNEFAWQIPNSTVHWKIILLYLLTLAVKLIVIIGNIDLDLI